VWPVPWAPYGNRAGVAGPLDPVRPLWGVAGPLGLVWQAWGRVRSRGPRMAAMGARPVP